MQLKDDSLEVAVFDACVYSACLDISGLPLLCVLKLINDIPFAKFNIFVNYYLR